MISTKKRQTILRYIAFTASLGFDALAQTPASTILTIEMENVVQYQENFANLSKNGTSAVMEAADRPSEQLLARLLHRRHYDDQRQEVQGNHVCQEPVCKLQPQSLRQPSHRRHQSISGHGDPA